MRELFGGEAFRRLFRKPESICDRDSLGKFLDSRASFMAQKGIVEFCRVRAGIYWQKLFQEDDFRYALSYSCWQAYSPCLALAVEMTEASVREHAGIERRRAADELVEVAWAAYSAYPVPEGFTAEEWAARFGLVRDVMEGVKAAAARPVRDMPKEMARLVFKSLPLHPSIVTHDSDYIHNNLRMHLLRAHEDLLKAADFPALARVLTTQVA